MFGDIDMRARMNRLGGFDWGGHKRHGFPDTEQFFKNDFHQFPGFSHGAFNRPMSGGQQERKPTTTTSTHHIGSPGVSDRSQFYDHVPDEFRQYFPESFGHSFGRMRHQPQPQQAAQSPPQHQSPVQPRVVHQHQQTAVRPDEFVYQKQQVSPPRPKVCDAAIQTDILADSNNLNQHGLRNTMDLGQKSPTEESQANERAHSAPPPAQQNQSGPFQSADGMHSNIGTSMTPQSASGNQHQFNYPQSQTTPQQPDENRERCVPIVVQHHQAPRPAPFTPRAEPQPASEDTTDNIPPQTPHTSDCISKIQQIQTDVLDLMGSVDRFNGSRGDKDYMFIDEMLTRNLLKLDTIDTNGRESIRLARKEAIRCIQASITVLEAKAEQNANKNNKKVEEQHTAHETALVMDQPSKGIDEGNIEQSLEEKLNAFQRQSEEREPATHVSEVNINVNGS